MKSYTNLEQSKKLAEILPIESADMFWYRDAVTKEVNPRIMNYIQVPELQSMYYSPCWSLAALLEILPEGVIENYYVPNLQKENGKYSIAYGNEELLCVADNPLDVCYEMILKLHEQKNIVIMTEEEVKDKMQEGFAKIQPKVAEMTNIIMDAYQEGFNTCFELLTGQKFK